jgi:membrane-associated phospholipid phosphatase
MPKTCRNCRRFLLPGLLLAAAAALWIDVPVALAFKHVNTQHSAKAIRDYLGYLNVFEPFGHGLGVALVLFALHQLDRGRRWAIPRVLACALAAGAIANLLKILLLRIRPNDLPADFTGTVWDTFGRWLPMLSGESGGQSFPSAHTAAAVGLAAALIWLYPNGRLLFTALAVLVGCQRIVAGAHYPSDVLVGAAAGCLAATLLLHVGWLPVWFDEWESRWRSS